MNIDETVKQAAETIAKAKIAEALGGDILGRIIDEVMNHKNRSYGAKDTPTLFDQIVRETIETLIRQTVREQLFANEAIKEKLKTAITEQSDKFATTIIQAFMNEDWRAELKIEIRQ